MSRSRRQSSVWMVATSAAGSTLFSTWITFSSSKQRTTWAMASTSRMWARNWLPRPSPFEAPRTRPAMSTKRIVVGTVRSGWTILASASMRGSGTGTMPTLGLDGAERIVRALGPGVGEGVEERALADVRQTDDAAGETHKTGLIVGARRITRGTPSAWFSSSRRGPAARLWEGRGQRARGRATLPRAHSMQV